MHYQSRHDVHIPLKSACSLSHFNSETPMRDVAALKSEESLKDRKSLVMSTCAYTSLTLLSRAGEEVVDYTAI